MKNVTHRHLSCISAGHPVALITYVLLFDCEVMICEAYSESSDVQELCASPGVSMLSTKKILNCS